MRSSFEWDEEKAKANLKKHGINFDEAATIFADPFSITIPDPDHSLHEQRYIDIGVLRKTACSWWSMLSVAKGCASSVVAKRRLRSAESMKNAANEMVQAKGNNMRGEYDFSGGVRGKHCRAMQAGYTITVHKADGTTVIKDVMPKGNAVLLEPDVREYFPDSRSVNEALRCLIPLLPKKQRTKARRR